MHLTAGRLSSNERRCKTMSRECSRPDIEGLKKFASRVLTKDRGATPFFSGRHQEIEDIELSIEGVMERHRNGRQLPASDETWLFQGPPGVGKSALLAQLVERWNSKENETTPVSLLIPAELMYNQAHLVAEIAEAVAIANNDAETVDKLRQIVSVGYAASSGIGGEFFKASAQSSGKKHITTNPHELTWKTLTTLFPLEMWRRPVVLMLDEVQSLRKSGSIIGIIEFASRDSWFADHSYFRWFVGFLRRASQGMIFSRMSHRRRITLGALEQSEAEDAVKKMLDTFRVEGSNQSAWTTRIAKECSGWPQHLQTGLQALAKILVGNEGKTRPN